MQRNACVPEELHKLALGLLVNVDAALLIRDLGEQGLKHLVQIVRQKHVLLQHALKDTANAGLEDLALLHQVVLVRVGLRDAARLQPFQTDLYQVLRKLYLAQYLQALEVN